MTLQKRTLLQFVHLRNSNKQHLILTKLYVNNAASIGNHIAKLQLNLSTQTVVTTAFVMSPQNVKCPLSSIIEQPHRQFV